MRNKTGLHWTTELFQNYLTTTRYYIPIFSQQAYIRLQAQPNTVVSITGNPYRIFIVQTLSQMEYIKKTSHENVIAV